MDLEDALVSLGVTDTTLSDEEKSTLDDTGYVPFPGLLSAREVVEFGKRLDELYVEEGEEAGKEVHQEEGTWRLSNLVDKDPMFERVITEPRLLAAVCHVVGPSFKLSSLNSRAALPGHGRQGLHADWGKGVEPGEYTVCNSFWLLNDFTAENGATRVVPGSHRSRKIPSDEMEDPTADHANQVQVIAPAGTVVAVNSHLWHGGVLNKTDEPRRVMHGYFCQRDQGQQTDQQKWLRPETLERLSPEAKAVLDV